MSKEDLDTLRSLIINVAGEQLKRHGGFAPFGASISSDGALAMAAADTGSDDPEERLTSILRGFCEQADAGEIRAAGYCVEMRLEDIAEYPGGVDAIYICLEDGAPLSRKYVYPFDRAASYKLEEALTEEGEAIIFGGEEEVN